MNYCGLNKFKLMVVSADSFEQSFIVHFVRHRYVKGYQKPEVQIEFVALRSSNIGISTDDD